VATPRICVIGSANVDLTTFTDRFPSPGETIFADRFDLGWGGKGANQAVAARLCGAEVDVVARVGDDLFGSATIANFEAHGIGVDHVRVVKGVSSGVAPIFVESSGQNRIIVVKGANDRLLPADIDAARPLIERADCVVVQLEVPLETVYHAIALAHQLGRRCILNPAPGQPLDLVRIASVDYFVPNESEAETITGRPVRTVAQARSCARFLRAQGLRHVIVTLGSKGALFASGPDAEWVPPFTVDPKDTTGAGDAFIGSFGVFLAESGDHRDSVARASLYAAMSTTAVGTQKSFVSRQRFDAEWSARQPSTSRRAGAAS
jgi:ribokinase